jgi:hypothetical protein
LYAYYFSGCFCNVCAFKVIGVLCQKSWIQIAVIELNSFVGLKARLTREWKLRFQRQFL